MARLLPRQLKRLAQLRVPSGGGSYPIAGSVHVQKPAGGPLAPLKLRRDEGDILSVRKLQPVLLGLPGLICTSG